MPVIFQYLLKLSLSLGIVYLFYQFLLRRLTFYNCNRFYLLGYTALCFFIPLINITPALETNNWQADKITNIIPAWQITSASAETQTGEVAVDTSWNYWTMLAGLLLAGTVLLLFIFLVRYFSFRLVRRKAKLLSEGPVRVYQVDENIIPFSFGNAIFINHTLHNEEELREIIRHEFVHVRQKHSVDIIWAELLCMINWYNPFVWLLRKSIRQNLEFIADHQVIKSGFDKKQYQYMLLKVIGNNHFSIASQFNFSSLKKRIAMMNKDQTSKRQLLRLLLLLPAVAVLLLAFRQKNLTKDTISPGAVLPQPSVATAPSAVSAPVKIEAIAVAQFSDQPVPVDTIPWVNEKGYNISVHDTNGDCFVVIKDKNNKVVKKILMTDWNKDPEHYENLYGELPPPPPPVPPVPAAIGEMPVAPAGAPTPLGAAMPVPPAPAMGEPAPAIPPVPPAPPVIKLPEGVKRMSMNNGQVILINKDDKKETYDLNDPKEKEAFEKKYGKFPGPDLPASPAPAAIRDISYQPTASELNFMRRHPKVEKITWAQVTNFNSLGVMPVNASPKKGDVYIMIYFKNGKWDMYNTGNKTEVERFKKNYGETLPSSPYDEGC